MFHKPFAEITIDDIIALQTNGVEEGKTIDYKLTVSPENRNQRKEFAADITSFANTIGGDLIIGVKEEMGIIADIPGIEVTDKDKLLQDIENILRDAIEPQIMGLEMSFYPVENNHVLHIRVPQSYNGPHIVSGEKFYGRNNAGKYPLDYVEIKQRFTLSNQVQERIKQYHIERIMKIKADEGYWETGNGSAVLINIVPLKTFSENVYISALTPQRFKLEPLFGTGGYDHKIQFEGIAGIEGNSYHHLNRQGIVEIVDKEILSRIENSIHSKWIIERTLEVIPESFLNFNKLGLYGPYIVLTSILDVKGRIIRYNGHGFSSSRLRQNDMIFPAVMITDPSNLSEYDQMLKELFMNASGYFQTPYTL